MEHDPNPLVMHAVTLASAAQDLAESTTDPSSVTYLPAALSRVGETLDALTRALEGAAHSLVPKGDRFEPICDRFARAAADWPAIHGRESPSYERQAQLLTSLDDARATLRLSRRACARANQLLIDMTATDDGAAPVAQRATIPG